MAKIRIFEHLHKYEILYSVWEDGKTIGQGTMEEIKDQFRERPEIHGKILKYEQENGYQRRGETKESSLGDR